VRTMASLKALLPSPVNAAEKIQKLCIHGSAAGAMVSPRGTAPISLLPSVAKRRFGLEIESVISRSSRHQSFSDVLRSLNLNTSSWKIVDDKSVEARVGKSAAMQGDAMCCELVSPVLDYDSTTRDQIEGICFGLASDLRANTNTSCGLHIHLDAEDLSLRDIVRIASNYAYFEPVLDLFMSPGRRGSRNPYIQSVRRAMERPAHSELLRRVLDGEAGHLCKRSLSVLDAVNPKPRKKHKLNLTNAFYHSLAHSMGGAQAKPAESAYINTIENRHHDATLRYEDVDMWIRFNLCFVHHSKTKPVHFEDESVDNEGVRDREFIWRRFKVLAHFMEDDDMMAHYEQKLVDGLRGGL